MIHNPLQNGSSAPCARSTRSFPAATAQAQLQSNFWNRTGPGSTGAFFVFRGFRVDRGVSSSNLGTNPSTTPFFERGSLHSQIFLDLSSSGSILRVQCDSYTF